MDIRNCRNCGNIFNYSVGAVICPACRESLEAKFQEVKLYIEEHAEASMKTVAEECDVDPVLLQQWLREARLEVTEGSAVYLDCESCGAKIRSGRYCDKCKTELMRGLKGLEPPKPAPSRTEDDSRKKSARMRFLQ